MSQCTEELMGQKGRIKASSGNKEASGTKGIFIGSLIEARLCTSEKTGKEINSPIVINKMRLRVVPLGQQC